ncbi:MAG: phenylalanine--tRNA ligase subunit beta, partial [Candidatus Saccharimonadaceae bacterium]|nr:phenylalanine--tRNA ligase subunit beta [Candidatus Saccharimonadaceae bacterium]
YAMNDYLLDIENKSLTHRPDCFGVIGFAREVAAILGKSFVSPDWFMNLNPDFNISEKMGIDATILNRELSDRYQAIVMSNVDMNKKSPLSVQTYLARVGVRPINAVVDITNYLMIMTGQPLHAFDYDKFVNIAGGKAEISVRTGNDGEKLELLDGRTIELTSEDIVISAGEKAVALAGAMGGSSTEIDNNTKNIILESATFNLYKLRATQMRHGIFSEAITRFTKGQPADLTAPVLGRATELIQEWTGAEISSRLTDCYVNKKVEQSIKVSQQKINGTLGTDWDMKQLADPLCNAEFDVDVIESQTLNVVAPWWRADIHIPEDIIEEIARIKGFDNIEPTLPIRDFTATRPSGFDEFRGQVRKILARAGANEVLTYSFVHGDILRKAGQTPDNSYRIVNSISPDLQYYRQSLTPSLLSIIHPNAKQGYDEFALFEMNKTHNKKSGLNEENVPKESDNIALAISYKKSQDGSPYYRAKRMLDYLLKSLGIDAVYQSIDENSNIDDCVSAPFEDVRSACVCDSKTNALLGYVGEYNRRVSKAFKLTDYCAGFEIDSRALFEVVQNLGSNYKPISRYPSSERDVCFQVGRNIAYSQIIDSLDAVKDEVKLEAVISPIDIYQPKGVETKNITMNIKLTSNNHTLTSEEVTIMVDFFTDSVKKMTDAKVI